MNCPELVRSQLPSTKDVGKFLSVSGGCHNIHSRVYRSLFSCLVRVVEKLHPSTHIS